MDMFTGNKIKETYRQTHAGLFAMQTQYNIHRPSEAQKYNKDQAVEKEVQKIKV